MFEKEKKRQVSKQFFFMSNWNTLMLPKLSRYCGSHDGTERRKYGVVEFMNSQLEKDTK
jgi:hypothetical protein